MDTRLENKIVIVTGGASGIGEATVRAFAVEKATVMLLDRDEKRALALETELPQYVRALKINFLNSHLFRH